MTVIWARWLIPRRHHPPRTDPRSETATGTTPGDSGVLRQLHEPVAWQAGPADVLVAFAARVQIGELRVRGTPGKAGVWL
jgi:hypothetical protein